MKIYFALALLLVAATTVIGESASFQWRAEVDATPGIGVIQKAMLGGPMQKDTVPDSKGSFTCQYLFKKEWGTELKAEPDGTLVTNSVTFEIVSTEAGRDPVFMKTLFKTESIDVDEGDTFVMVFKTNKKTEMVFARIKTKFIPS